MSSPDDHRFLEGPFAPVAEEVTAFDLPVTGQVPAGLNGRYLRNGPNPLGLDDPDYHWFVGVGMVHGVRLRDGKAEWYRNRWVRSKAVADRLARDVASWAGPRGHGFRRQHLYHLPRWPRPRHGRGGRPAVRADRRARTVGPCDFAGSLAGGFAAHTKLDHATGELHAIAYFWAWDHVQHVVVDPGGKVTRDHRHPGPRRSDDA